jgi:hypothetical protein
MKIGKVIEDIIALLIIGFIVGAITQSFDPRKWNIINYIGAFFWWIVYLTSRKKNNEI